MRVSLVVLWPADRKYLMIKSMVCLPLVLFPAARRLAQATAQEKPLHEHPSLTFSGKQVLRARGYTVPSEGVWNSPFPNTDNTHHTHEV